MEWCTAGAMVVATFGAALALFGRLPWAPTVVWVAGSASAWLSYRAACSAARDVARHTRMQIDLRRADVLGMFGLLSEKPITARQERAVWEALHQWLEYSQPLPDQYGYMLKGAPIAAASSEHAAQPTTDSASPSGTPTPAAKETH